MLVDDLPNIAIDSAFGAIRWPLDRVAPFASGGRPETWPPVLLLQDIEVTVKRSLGSVLHNDTLRGAADASADGEVTVSEAFDYAKRMTIRDTAMYSTTPQSPSFKMNVHGKQDLVLARIAQSPSQIVIAQASGPLELVALDSGLKLLELPEGERRVRLAVPAGSYVLRRRAENGLQVVTWSLRPDADGTGVGNWMRWAGTPARTANELQETWLLTQQFQGNEPGQLRTLGGITQWQVYCYRGNSWSNCQSTGNIVANKQVLPAGVRIMLEFGSADLNGTLTRDIALGT